MKQCVDKENGKPSLDFHLAVMRRTVKGDYCGPSYDDWGGHADDHNMDVVEEEFVDTVRWIGEDDKDDKGLSKMQVVYDELGVGYEVLMIGGERNDFDGMEEHSDYERTYEDIPGGKVTYYYYITVLVIWPRRKLFRAALMEESGGVEIALNFLESRIKSASREEGIEVLSQLTEELNRMHVATSSLHILRLLSAATNLRDAESLSRIFLKLSKEARIDRDWFRNQSSSRGGIGSHQVAAAVAIAVKSIGYDKLKDALFSLLAACEAIHVEFCVDLVNKMVQENIDGADDVARSTARIALKDENLGLLTKEAAGPLMLLLLSIPACSIELGEFVNRADELASPSLADTLHSLTKYAKAHRLPNTDPLLTKLGQYASKRDFLGPDPLQNSFRIDNPRREGFIRRQSPEGIDRAEAASKMAASLFQLDNLHMLDSFVSNVTNVPGNEVILEAILKNPEVRRYGRHRGTIKPPFRALVEARISQISQSEPSFTFAMPDAQLPQSHDENWAVRSRRAKLLEFLKSDRESINIDGFRGVAWARRFGKLYFGNKMTQKQHNYCGRAATSGRGSAVICRITKTQQQHELKLKKWGLLRKEAAALGKILKAKR